MSSTNSSSAAASAGRLWAGRILSTLPVLMLLMSATMKITQPPTVIEQFVGKFGYPESLLLTLAVLEISCTLLYIIPRTSMLGAVLLTGYLGGAIATHVRVNDPGFVSGLLLGVCIWAGLWLRDERLRSLLPLR